MDKVNIDLELTEAQAEALAQFLKRSVFSDYRENAQSEDEAYLIRDAASELQDSLAKHGFNPR